MRALHPVRRSLPPVCSPILCILPFGGCFCTPLLLQVQNVDSLAGTAKGIIKSIQARAIVNKVILGTIVFLLVGIDVTLLYFLIKKK
jgi:hypothetical protein